MNQHDITELAIDNALQNLSNLTNVELIILDNGSDTPFKYRIKSNYLFSITTIRYEKSIGVYPTFWEGLKHATGDVLAFFHTDTIISEKGWNLRVLEAFKTDEKLGLIGFIGSTEIDGAGGRGLGTASNFQGKSYLHNGKTWIGSSAEVHGRRITGLEQGCVVDGCVMIFRRSVLEQIPQRLDFPPHHFYDRLLSTEVLERGYHVATLGIAFDHMSGQTVNQEHNYSVMAEDWCRTHGVGRLPTDHNWDTVIYKTAEHYWLTEYRDRKHFIPRVVVTGVGASEWVGIIGK